MLSTFELQENVYMKYGRYDWGNSPVGLTVK